MSRDYCGLHGMYYGMVCPSCYNKQLEHGIKKLSEGWGEHKDMPDEILKYVLEVLEHVKHDMCGDTNSILRVKVMMGIELIKNHPKTGGK